MITLRSVTLENFHACIDLRVHPEQQEFVASNVYSLAESRFEPSWVPFAIYAEEMLVGFLMYDGADYEVIRLMIDAQHQRKDYGRAAMKLLLEQMDRERTHPFTEISYVPENVEAENLYASLGYVRTGEIRDDEIVMRREIR